QELDAQEIQYLLKRSEHLIFFKGQWVEIDPDKLSDLLSKWKTVAKSVEDTGVTFAEGLRWLSGIKIVGADGEAQETQLYTRIISGSWLKKTLESLRAPEASQKLGMALRANLKAELRPYQAEGVNWLNTLNQMRLGAILADDMGLGKTIQTLALLLLRQSEFKDKSSPALLIVPASLIGNWKLEIDRFAPALKYWVAHPSGDGTENPVNDNFDVLITTYASVARISWLGQRNWGMIIAQKGVNFCFTRYANAGIIFSLSIY
ncbi:MAG: hypothetical protein KJ594_00005, partial [Candidatus Omnitrophica bacterium]|nr:hypothetical protein [Candidatus Omnitrophota bacterium]